MLVKKQKEISRNLLLRWEKGNRRNRCQTLQREIQEEVNLKVVKAEYVDEYEDIAIFEKIPIVVKVYLCEVEGEVEYR